MNPPCSRLTLSALYGVMQLLQVAAFFPCESSLRASVAVDVEKGENFLLALTLREQKFDPSTVALWKNNVNDSIIKECFLDNHPIVIKCGPDTNITVHRTFHIGIDEVTEQTRINIIEVLISSFEYGDSGNYTFDFQHVHSTTSIHSCRILEVALTV